MSAKIQVDKYYAALQRLKLRGAPISNDAVSLEAGSGRGSIKRSRPAYAELIVAIELAARECWRRPNFDHPCRLNFDQGREAVEMTAICG
jgi:hypothetical protein